MVAVRRIVLQLIRAARGRRAANRIASQRLDFLYTYQLKYTIKTVKEMLVNW